MKYKTELFVNSKITQRTNRMKITKEDYPIKETAHKKKNFENQGMK